MRYRERCWPRCPGDWCALLLLLTIVSCSYLSQVALVLPTLCSHAIWRWLHTAVSTWLLYGVLTHVAAVMTVDTSTRGQLLPATCPPGWHFCAPCDAPAPPRAWHCDVCGACILRRDHHCVFVGACVGHANTRYYLLLLAYLALSAAYVAICHALYIIVTAQHSSGGGGGVWSPLKVLSMLLPMLSFVWHAGKHMSLAAAGTTDDSTLLGQWTMLLCAVSVVGGMFVAALLVYHGQNALHGLTCRERQRGVLFRQKRGGGGWRHHARAVFGHRWYWTWLSPAVHSPLPNNGFNYCQSADGATVSDEQTETTGATALKSHKSKTR